MWQSKTWESGLRDWRIHSKSFFPLSLENHWKGLFIIVKSAFWRIPFDFLLFASSLTIFIRSELQCWSKFNTELLTLHLKFIDDFVLNLAPLFVDLDSNNLFRLCHQMSCVQDASCSRTNIHYHFKLFWFLFPVGLPVQVIVLDFQRR